MSVLILPPKLSELLYWCFRIIYILTMHAFDKREMQVLWTHIMHSMYWYQTDTCTATCKPNEICTTQNMLYESKLNAERVNVLDTKVLNKHATYRHCFDYQVRIYASTTTAVVAADYSCILY